MAPDPLKRGPGVPLCCFMKYKVQRLEINEKIGVTVWFVVVSGYAETKVEACRCQDANTADLIAILMNRNEPVA